MKNPTPASGGGCSPSAKPLRHEHRQLNKHGQCRRCGLTPAHTKFCPPGFWMTKAERAEWDAVPRDERGSQYPKYDALERKFRERASASGGNDNG